MNYWIFLMPIIAGLATQLIKVIIEASQNQFSWHLFKKYGGMPSSHSAFVFALLTEVSITDGFYSAAFATALILTVLTVRDATGFRRLMDAQAKTTNKLVDELPSEKRDSFSRLPEVIGHTPLQITVGAILGIAIVLVGNLFI